MNPVILIGAAVLLFALRGGGGEARKLAQQLAADVTKRKYDYSRALAKKFQTAAGIPSDGIYGPATASKVSSYGVKAPKALFVGAGAKKAKPAPVIVSKPLALAKK